MEIYTQNLLTVTVSHDRIQSNFTVIDAALKSIQSQLSQLTANQQFISESITNNRLQIKNIHNQVKSNSDTLRKHKEFIDQFQIQEESNNEIQPPQKIAAPRCEETEGNQGDKIQANVRQNRSQVLPQKVAFEDGRSQIQQFGKRMITEDSKAKTPRKPFDKVISGLKDRLQVLEQDSQSKEYALNQLKSMIEKYRLKEHESVNNRKVSLELIKKSSSKKHIYDEKSRVSLKASENEVKQESFKSISKQFSEMPDSADVNSVFQFNGGNQDESGEPMTKQLSCLKDALVEKIRSIEAQFKESQNRMQGIEKTMDILERSHEMLKYDFDRTSTSWSKHRPIQTKDRSRGDQRLNGLNDTRVTNRDQYQEKLLQLFNEMDRIKKQYHEIQNRCCKEEETFESQHTCLKSPEQGKEKYNSKTVYSLKMEGEQRKQLALVKRELAKLRQDFNEFAWGVNTTSGEVKTVVIKPNENKEDWKILSTKMYKLRMELQAGLRDLQGKIATNNDMVVVLNGLEVGIEECRLLLKRKVQHSDYEKGLKRIEGRLNNFILQVYQKESKQQQAEAALVKQPWFCLSCDNQLKNYTGKMQKSPPKEKLMGRKVNPENHMVRRNESGKLPSVLK